MQININTRKESEPDFGPSGVSWDKAPTILTRRCVFIEVYGDTGSGRSTFALSAPGPIALLHAAEKLEGVVQQFSSDKEIRMFNFGGVYNGNPDEIREQASQVWLSLRAAWFDAFRWAKTIVLDTHTEAWELARIAYFGDYKPTKGRVDANYGPVNADWKSLFKHFRQQDKVNIITIGQTKDEYRESKGVGILSSGGVGQRTGKTIRAGQKDIPIMADMVVRTSRGEGGSFVSVIEKGWWNAKAEGVEMSNEISNFDMAINLVTETDPEEWK